MAIDVELVAPVTPTVTAAVDLSGHQNKFVQVMGAGVLLADARSASFTSTYVLKNKPRSGENCTLSGKPNIDKVIAGEAITRGQVVHCMSATGLASVTSAGDPSKVGIAWSTVAGSGEYVSVKQD
jgi:hypothetical protein